MKKIEIDKKKVKKFVKKAIPWVIGGGVVAVGGVILYKKGFAKGIYKGADLTTKGLADYLAIHDNFAIYNNSANVPVVFNGVGIHSTEDVETAVKMLDVVAPVEGEDAFANAVKQLTDIIFDNKRPIKITNF